MATVGADAAVPSHSDAAYRRQRSQYPVLIQPPDVSPPRRRMPRRRFETWSSLRSHPARRGAGADGRQRSVWLFPVSRLRTVIGISTVRFVPSLGHESTVNVPPKIRTRSAIPLSPYPNELGWEA